MTADGSLVLFSRVRPERRAYPATYHPDRWWPVKDNSYMVHAYYDSTKVYHID